MVVFSSLFELKLTEPNVTNGGVGLKDVVQIVSTYVSDNQQFGKLCYEDRDELGNVTMFYKTQNKSLLLSYDNLTCITLDAKTTRENEKDRNAVLREMMKFEQALQSVVKSRAAVKRIPTLVRDGDFWRYTELSDSRIMEGDQTEIVFHKKSPYQNVEIVKSPTYGNVLRIDDVENLAESDISYTLTACGIGRGVDYEDKTVLILGGGDGACLHEICKLLPKFVTMIDIDQAVIDGCKEHMRSVCGDVLDKMDADNYKIIVDDCFPWLEKYVSEGRQFDVIISDLTDTPCFCSDNADEVSVFESSLWQFFRKVLNHCLNLVKPDGVILCHVTGVSNVLGIEQYNKQLKLLEKEITYSRIDEFVPSFVEKWVFYQIKLNRRPGSDGA